MPTMTIAHRGRERTWQLAVPRGTAKVITQELKTITEDCKEQVLEVLKKYGLAETHSLFVNVDIVDVSTLDHYDDKDKV